MEKLPLRLFPFCWHFIKKQWVCFLFIQIFCFSWSIDHTFWPYILMLVIDGITSFGADRAHIWSALSTPIFLGIVLWITLEFGYRMAGILMSRALPKLEADIRMAMFNYVQRHSYTYFGNNFAGSIANKISDITQSLTRIVTQIMTLFLPVILAMVIAIGFFAQIHFLFAAILGIWIITHVGICLFFSKECDLKSEIHAEARSILSGKIVDSLTNNINVKLFARYNFEYQYLYKSQHNEQEKHSQALWSMEKMKLMLGITAFLGPLLALNWFMLYQWQKGYLTTGEVVFIFNTNWNIMMMAWIAGLELPLLFREIGICKQALSLIQDPHDIVDDPHAKPLKVTKGEIVFDHVTFHYVPAHNIFQDKNIVIKAGEKVGLVGLSGSGKTTFVNLILRYFDVEKGRILIDGQDISLVTQNSLREQLALVPQDPSLFHRTLMENIRYGRLDASDEEVIEASVKARCHEFILKQPEAYSSLVGERGIKLSGGQRQRIAIARAILKNAPILIFDEATSSLDSMTEKHIQEGLKELIEGKTAIVIAHRLSTLSDMDRILVFKDGKIVEEGSHEELLAEQGHYAAMWQMQAGGFLPDSFEDDEVFSSLH